MSHLFVKRQVRNYKHLKRHDMLIRSMHGHNTNDATQRKEKEIIFCLWMNLKGTLIT